MPAVPLLREARATGTAAAQAAARGSDPYLVAANASQITKDCAQFTIMVADEYYQNACRLSGRVTASLAWTLAALKHGDPVGNALFIESLITAPAQTRIINKAYADGFGGGAYPMRNKPV